MAIPSPNQLLKLLEKIDRPGMFCTRGSLPSILPGLDVEGLGQVALPLGKRDATALKKLARQAPYGKGTQTVVDTAVRRVWEIDAEQVALTNPEWAKVVEQAVGTVQTALGLEKEKLKAHLYKVLLYDQGSFFLPHRDGEKLDRMVATLVIALPSQHAGGELVVRHEGREEVVDFGPESAFQTQFAAFYADCEHEIRPVTSGYRLALVYNLTLTKAKRTIAAPSSGEHVTAIAGLLKAWTKKKPAASLKEDEPTKLAVLLGHQYTLTGLALDSLKGIDRAKADILFAAAREAGCDASTALVTCWETGSAEPTGDYGYGGSYGRRRYDDYDEDEYGDDGVDGGEYEMEDLEDSTLTAAQFRDADGELLAFGELPLIDEEIVSGQDRSEWKPDRQDFEGYTGNAGMTLERWYHRAAVVLWPAASRFDVLCEAGMEVVAGGLAQMVKQWKKARATERSELHQQCLKFADRILANWPERKYSGRYSRVDNGKPADPLIAQLELLEEPRLISAYITGVLAKDASLEPGKKLGAVCKKHGWQTFRQELRNLFAKTSNETLERHARLLADFAMQKDKNADRKSLCTDFAEQLVAATERWTPQKPGDWEAKIVEPAELLPPLVQALLALEASKLLDRLVTCVLDRPAQFDWTTVQIPVLLKLQPWLKKQLESPSAPLRRWLTAVHKTLDARAAKPPQAPTDWRRKSSTGCKCGDCEELRRFLEDPDRQTAKFPLAKQRRQHLHQVIGRNLLDTTHVTLRTGSPQTLVCTKTKASYERDAKIHQVDLDHLKKIQHLLEWHEEL